MDMGNIDLSLLLTQSGQDVTGYIGLENTLVFTREQTIQVTPEGPTPAPGTPAPAAQPLDVGPRVSGTFDGTTLNLLSDQFSLSLDGRVVKCQFRLTGTKVQAGDVILQGQYRETLTDYAQEPSTIVGAFSLRRPVYDFTYSQNPIYLPVVLR
jgi:hypothetical protein